MVKFIRKRRLEWFGQIKRRDETETIGAVTMIKIDGMPLRGRPKLRWKKHCQEGPESIARQSGIIH